MIAQLWGSTLLVMSVLTTSINLTNAFFVVTKSAISISSRIYQQDNDIDWDADLFAQLNQSGSKDGDTDSKWGVSQSNTDSESMRKQMDTDSQWGVPQSNTDMKSMRKQMKQSWGVEKSEETSPTDWMPGYTEGPDQDEPWFTG
jgi:hypothetical protein